MTTTTPGLITGSAMDETRRSRARMAERLLNDADLTPAELRKRLDQHAMCDNPGAHIEHIIKTWQQWNEINPQTADEESAKLRLEFQVYEAVCFLVTPAGAR